MIRQRSHNKTLITKTTCLNERDLCYTNLIVNLLGLLPMMYETDAIPGTDIDCCSLSDIDFIAISYCFFYCSADSSILYTSRSDRKARVVCI